MDMMSDTEVITWRFQSLLDCMTTDGPCDASTLERVQVACGDIKQILSLWDRVPSHSSAPPWSIVDSLKETCLEYCQQCLESQDNDVQSMKYRIIMTVYDAIVLYARCLPVVWQLDAVLECTFFLLKMHALISSKTECHSLDKFMACIVDELIEILPHMEQLSRELMGGLQLPEFWFEAMIRGHLALAKEAAHEVVRCNALSTVKDIFERVSSSPSRKHETRRLAMLCTEHHYDMAVALSLGREQPLDVEGECPGNRTCLHHCNEALSYGQVALENTGMLEHKVELEFVIKELVLLKATCLLNAGELQEASKELSALPDWSGEDDPVYYNLFLDFILLQMRLQTLLKDLEQTTQCLRSFAVFSKRTLLYQNVSTIERLGRAFIHSIHTFGCHSDIKQRMEFIDAMVFFMQTVGVSAMMHAIKALPKRLQNADSQSLSLMFDILTNKTVCMLIRREDLKNQNVCWDAFQQMAHSMFLCKDVDTCIKFVQALLHYGPENKVQHVYAILFSLYVYSRNYSMAEYCRKKLGSSSLKQHPFVMGIMLLEELETSSSSNTVENTILEDMNHSPQKWTEESVHAIRGIGEIYARKKLQKLGLGSHMTPFHTLELLCNDESKSTDDVIDSMEGIICLRKEESFKASFTGLPSKVVLNAIRAMLLVVEKKSVENSTCALKFFDTALLVMEVARSLVANDSWALTTLDQFEFCLRVLQCNEYLNHVGDIEVQNVVKALEECKNVSPVHEESNQAIALLQVRLSLLANVPIPADFNVVEQLLGDTYFVEFIAAHMIQLKTLGKSIPEGLLEHLSSSGIELDRLLISLSHRVDHTAMFRLYSRIVQSLGSNDIGFELFPKASHRLRSKLCFLMPWMFSPVLEATVSMSEETSSCPWSSTMSESSSDSSAVDSPPAKRQTLAEADDLVSSLIKDLAEEETIGSFAGTRQGIWTTWIKKVLG
jgi:hypothetical protein